MMVGDGGRGLLIVFKVKNFSEFLRNIQNFSEIAQNFSEILRNTFQFL
jgi:hypothetical protein